MKFYFCLFQETLKSNECGSSFFNYLPHFSSCGGSLNININITITAISNVKPARGKIIPRRSFSLKSSFYT